jgi:hypothetical protein
MGDGSKRLRVASEDSPYQLAKTNRQEKEEGVQL